MRTYPSPLYVPPEFERLRPRRFANRPWQVTYEMHGSESTLNIIPEHPGVERLHYNNKEAWIIFKLYLIDRLGDVRSRPWLNLMLQWELEEDMYDWQFPQRHPDEVYVCFDCKRPITTRDEKYRLQKKGKSFHSWCWERFKVRLLRKRGKPSVS